MSARVLVLGGTRFIGRAIVGQLVAEGHEVTIVHRGVHEPDDLPEVRHLHSPRAEWDGLRGELRTLAPDAVVDCLAMNRDDVQRALAVLPDTHLVVISSLDVYRAFASLQHDLETDAVPIDESSPVRADRQPAGGRADQHAAYSKLDVEEEYATRGAVALRVPVTYGEHDEQRREEFVLRRVRAGRPRIPIGAGTLLLTRGYVRDIARGASAAALRPATAGEVINLGEQHTWSVRLWAERIAAAAGVAAIFETVPDALLPPDMSLTATSLRQHVLASTAKARALLDYTDTDPLAALQASVTWHLAHPPDGDGNFAADDTALVASFTDPGAPA